MIRLRLFSLKSRNVLPGKSLLLALSTGLGLAWSLGSLAATAVALEPHPRVAGFQRFYQDEKSDKVIGGQLLLGELNCTSCHQADQALATYVLKKPAPVLDTIGTRVRPPYLMKFLADPQATKPGTTMPNVMAALPMAERAEKAEAIAHFLATTGISSDGPAMRQSVNRGDVLYHSAGCVACHGPRKEDSPKEPLNASIVLGTPSRKYTIAGMAQFLANPLAVRPGGRMPHLNLSEGEAHDVAVFLLKDLDLASSALQFSLYEGKWNNLPDFSQLKAKEVGDADDFTVSVTKLTSDFALRFDGVINIPKEGEYTFMIGSDDGSRLLIDNREVIKNDGVRPYSVKQQKIKLSAGEHPVAVEYFEVGGEEVLTVEVSGPDMPKQGLNRLLVAPAKKEAGDKPASQAFVIDGEKAKKGREYFVSLGCASCHSLTQNGAVLASSFKAPDLAALKTSGGCLADAPSKAPFFALSPRQKETLSAALEAAKKPVAPLASADSISRNLVRLNCVACHQRGELGGVEDERNPHFQSDMPEMGDEGRLPPAITDVGAKLQTEWLKNVLEEGTKVRPYMFTQMPKFGSANVGTLVTQLDEVDSATAKLAPKVPEDDSDKKFKNVGRRLVGSQGFSCIKCHTFAGKKSTGIQALSMTDMTKRLKVDWFHHYMLNPQVYRPGTRMPGAWPGGQTQLPTVLDGSTDKQIRSVWAYLKDGNNATLPVGLVTGAIELMAFDEAIMYRNFIEGAGSRAIGVGYPEKLNLAFDANQMRLALIWQGAFIDAARHWNGRGEGYQPPLGDNIIRFEEGPDIAVLADPKASWLGNAKEAGFQFQGYRLMEARRPKFKYSYNGVTVEDYLAPAGDADAQVLRRTLTFTAKEAPANLYFRAGSGSVEELGNSSFKLDGKLILRIKSAGLPIVVDGGKKQVRVPVTFQDGKAEITVEYDW